MYAMCCNNQEILMSKYNMKSCTTAKIFVLLGSIIFYFYISTAIAEDMPKTLEALEAYEAENLIDDSATNEQVTSNTVLQQFNLHVKRTKLACIKAIGHEKFCHCISENMPSDQEFANYVVAVSKTKEELKFGELSEYYQQAINLARTARDKCVAESM